MLMCVRFIATAQIAKILTKLFNANLQLYIHELEMADIQTISPAFAVDVQNNKTDYINLLLITSWSSLQTKNFCAILLVLGVNIVAKLITSINHCNSK